jgi:hypothetical protein
LVPDITVPSRPTNNKKGKAYARIEKVLVTQRGKALITWLQDSWPGEAEGNLASLAQLCESLKGAVDVIAYLNSAMMYRLIEKPTRKDKFWTAHDIKMAREWLDKKQTA